MTALNHILFRQVSRSENVKMEMAVPFSHTVYTGVLLFLFGLSLVMLLYLYLSGFK